MRRWNGWGDDTFELAIPEGAEDFLADRIGEGSLLESASLDHVLAKVPATRMPEHSLINVDPEVRVRHARGQSLPDWLAMRSGDFGVFPDGVAFPESSEQVRELLQFAEQEDVIVIPYGGGTSVAGHITPEVSDKPVLTIDMGRMNRLMDLNLESQIATFGAGTPGPEVESQLRVRGYTLGHFPQSFELSTVGGWVVTRSSGQQSLRYGRIEQLFAGGKIETPQGTLDIPTFPASSAGPDVREMVLGSEGRMGIITETKVRVTPLAEKEKFYVVFFPSWEQACSAVRALAQQKIQLSMVRLSNAVETETQLALAGHPKGIAWLERYLALRGARDGKCMMTFGVTGSKAQFSSGYRLAKKVIRKYNGVSTGTYLGNKWAAKRFSFPHIRETLWEMGYAVDTLETATDWDNVDNLLSKIEGSLRYGLKDEGESVHVFTHLSHVYGQGSSIYTSYAYRVADDYAGTLARWKKLKHAASTAITENNGTISHQHGVGMDHAPYLPVEKGELGMRAIKTLCREFDPDGRMNPGKLFR